MKSKVGKYAKKMVVFILALSLFLIFLAGCMDSKRGSDLDPKGDFKAMRENMVETQIKARGVKDPRVLSAMLKVERHLFVPEGIARPLPTLTNPCPLERAKPSHNPILSP